MQEICSVKRMSLFREKGKKSSFVCFGCTVHRVQVFVDGEKVTGHEGSFFDVCTDVN